MEYLYSQLHENCKYIYTALNYSQIELYSCSEIERFTNHQNCFKKWKTKSFHYWITFVLSVSV